MSELLSEPFVLHRLHIRCRSKAVHWGQMPTAGIIVGICGIFVARLENEAKREAR
jgi:hypothetical protein